jgi:serine/threonine protein kinase
MERCFGGDLKEFMEKEGKPLPEIVAQKFVRDIANGLKVMLDNNIIHRDLKPANLLLDKISRIDAFEALSGVGILKIADFGLAREIYVGELAETQLGSPNYMAPEVMDGVSYDGRADLFSVGVILYEMLYGHLPWKARSMYELRNKIYSERPNFSQTVNPQAISLMQKLLQFDPNRRLNFVEFYNHPYLTPPSGSPTLVVPNSNENLVLDAFHAVLFDFSSLGGQDETIDGVEAKAKCAWYIAEAANACGQSLHAFSLYVRSLRLLLETIKKAPKNYSARMDAVITWMRNRYVDFERKADALKVHVFPDTVCPEKILFEYAVRIGNEAANDELMVPGTDRICIYTRSKSLIDYLLEQKQEQDTVMLTGYSKLFGFRIKHLQREL